MINLIKKVEVQECISEQSIDNYECINSHNEAFSNLKSGKDLMYTIRTYRRNLPIKYRIKIRLKEYSAYLPSFISKRIKNIYRILYSRVIKK